MSSSKSISIRFLQKISFLQSQKLLYLLYHTILQHSQHSNFYFPIQHIKVLYLHNKISLLSLISVSLPPPFSLSIVNKPKTQHNHHPNLTIPPLANHQQHNLPPPSSTTQPPPHHYCTTQINLAKHNKPKTQTPLASFLVTPPNSQRQIKE